MTTIRPLGISSPHAHGLRQRYRSKKNPDGVLHVAYTNGGLYFGGLVTGPSSPPRTGTPSPTPASWHIVTLVSSTPPFSRPDTEIISITPETYVDLVRAETAGFWPAFNDHVYALRMLWENKAKEMKLQTGKKIKVPDWIAHEIREAATRAAYDTIWAEESEGTSGRLPKEHALLEARIETYLKDIQRGS